MKISILLFLIGISTSFGQNFVNEEKIEQLLTKHKVNISEPITLNDGELVVENKLYGFDGKPNYHNQITIDLSEISEIETEYYEKTKIHALKFISGSDKSILETQLNSKDLFKLKSTRINLRHIDSELLAELINILKSYRK
ncbi:hypothetical protein [Winogradskyella sediminis]|uniref:hypothetical protein n=1 Tax=Winogradskyella sediminis TaxID=1382466 RepID=UPI003AA966D8